MSLVPYILALVAGGVVIGVVVGLLVRRTSSEGMVPPIMLAVVATLVVGLFLTEFADADRLIGLPVALTLATIYVARSGLSDKHMGHWIGRDTTPGSGVEGGDGD